VSSELFEFIEAPAFARYRDRYLTDDEFPELQATLIANPKAGENFAGRTFGGARESAAVCGSSTTIFYPSTRFG